MLVIIATAVNTSPAPVMSILYRGRTGSAWVTNSAWSSSKSGTYTFSEGDGGGVSSGVVKSSHESRCITWSINRLVRYCLTFKKPYKKILNRYGRHSDEDRI